MSHRIDETGKAERVRPQDELLESFVRDVPSRSEDANGRLPLLGGQADLSGKCMEVPDKLFHDQTQPRGIALAEARHHRIGNVLGRCSAGCQSGFLPCYDVTPKARTRIAVAMAPVPFTTGGPARRRIAHCSFCAKSQHDVAQLCGGPGTHDNQPFICNDCAAVAAKLVAEGNFSRGQSCSFCAKRLDRVKGLIAAGATPGASICNECVALIQQRVFADS